MITHRCEQMEDWIWRTICQANTPDEIREAVLRTQQSLARLDLIFSDAEIAQLSTALEHAHAEAAQSVAYAAEMY